MRESRRRKNTAVIAAMTIIVSSVAWMRAKQNRRAQIHKSIEEAVDTWEAEGGALPVERDEMLV